MLSESLEGDRAVVDSDRDGKSGSRRSEILPASRRSESHSEDKTAQILSIMQVGTQHGMRRSTRRSRISSHRAHHARRGVEAHTNPRLFEGFRRPGSARPG